MVIQEQSAGDVEGNEHIDAVMLMSSEDEEDSKAITQPGKGVKEDNPARCVLGYEEVQERERHSVTREHVVPASPDPLEAHTRPRPDDKRLMQAAGPAAIGPGLAVQVDPRHTQAGDQHCEAPEQEDCAANGKTPPRNDEPVFVEDDDKQPDGQ